MELGTLHQIEASNALNQSAFADRYGALFESSPWIAKAAWQRRPFRSAEHMLEAMCEVVLEADEASKLELLRAHPELGERTAMTDHSVFEQTSAGLTDLERDEAFVLRQLNKQYRERFGFPFIMAVRGLSPELIADSMQSRMGRSYEEELEQALLEVCKIAAFRLRQLSE